MNKNNFLIILASGAAFLIIFTIIMNSQQTSDKSDADTQTKNLSTQSDSTQLDDIEDDLNATDLQNIDSELDAIDTQLTE